MDGQAAGIPLRDEQIAGLIRGKASRPRGQRVRGNFLAGPIPLAWLRRASQLPGKALAVGLAAWYKQRITKRTQVNLNPALLNSFGVSRRSGYQALTALVAAGLLAADRHRGRSPVVTILDVEVDDTGDESTDDEQGCPT